MNNQPSVITYQQSEELDLDKGAQVKKAMNRIFTAITWAILIAVLAVWTVVGAVFWIPLMLRAMLRFSLSLVQSVFVGQRPDGAARILRDAVSFYRRGFVVAVEVVTKEEVEGEAKDPQTGNLLLLELMWAIPVWYLILFSMGWIPASPAEIWGWFASIQWGAELGSLIDWFRGW